MSLKHEFMPCPNLKTGCLALGHAGSDSCHYVIAHGYGGRVCRQAKTAHEEIVKTVTETDPLGNVSEGESARRNTSRDGESALTPTTPSLTQRSIGGRKG